MSGRERYFARLRDHLRAGIGRLKYEGWSIVQTAIATSIAYYLAVVVLGHEQPFYAALATVLSIGIRIGQEGSRAIQMVLGVAFGFAVADFVLLTIGTGVVQIGIVVSTAMTAAVLLNARPLLVTQAGTSAILIATLEPPSPSGGISPDRFYDALIGASVAVAINYLLPIDPVPRVKRSGEAVFRELISTLNDTADALAEHDPVKAERALSEARRIDRQVDTLREDVAIGVETARYSPVRRRHLGYLETYEGAADQIDLAVRNCRVLSRSAVVLMREGKPAPELLPEAVRDLARAVRCLAHHLNAQARPDEARRLALKAAESATAALNQQDDLTTSRLVGQVRGTAVDLLRASGLDQEAVLEALEGAVRRASKPGQ